MAGRAQAEPAGEHAPRAAAMPGVGLEALPRDELEAMHDAAATVIDCQAALAQAGSSPVAEVLRGAPDFEEWGHYPDGDVQDQATGAQYYYHAHAARERANGEHGHFHLFVRPPLAGLSPAPDPRFPSGDAHAPEDRISHLVALSMDGYGRPLRFFTTNRWVCDDTWYPAGTVIGLLDRFSVTGDAPSPELNRWLAAMVRLFKPQIAALLRERDRAIERALTDRAADDDVLEDRSLQNLSEAPVDLLVQIRSIEDALGID